MIKIIRKPELCANLGVSPTTLWRWIKEGNFPQPIKLGQGDRPTVGWLATDINEWITARASER